MKNSHLAGVACVLCYIGTAVAYLVSPGANFRHEVPSNGTDYRQIFSQFVETGDQQNTDNQQDQDKKKIATSLLVVTDASWCKPCQKLEIVLDKMIKEGYTIVMETPAQYRKRPAKQRQRVESLPTLFFMDGGKVKTVATGFQTEAFIKQYLGKPNPSQSN